MRDLFLLQFTKGAINTDKSSGERDSLSETGGREKERDRRSLFELAAKDLPRKRCACAHESVNVCVRVWRRSEGEEQETVQSAKPLSHFIPMIVCSGQETSTHPAGAFEDEGRRLEKVLGEQLKH